MNDLAAYGGHTTHMIWLIFGDKGPKKETIGILLLSLIGTDHYSKKSETKYTCTHIAQELF